MLQRELFLGLSIGLCAAVQTGFAAAEREPFFETDVRPILKAHCFQCHGEETELAGELDVRLARLIRQGGSLGPAVIPGKAEESLLWQRVRADEMPEGDTKLTSEQKEVLRRWIEAGAKTARAEPDDPETAFITEQERSHWAFQPITRPVIPSLASEGMNPIDAFLLEKLDAKGLAFSPEADKRTLIRRVSFDLIGLPPSPEEVQHFLADDSPQAYERVVDHLLSQPQYGERWGRHWLDVAGYSESDVVAGKDEIRPDAFRYRNYVIRSFNEDKPFDQFIREQLAGDELAMREGVWPADTVSPRAAELLSATGFLRMALDPTAGEESLATRNQVLADTLNVVSTSLLGLTVGCAQCHDHRFDPLLQEDYYRLQAVFQPVFDLDDWRKPSDRRVSLYTELERARAEGIEAGAKAWLKEIDRRKQAALDRVFEQRLQEVPEADREAVREARNTNMKSQSDEQKALLAKYPRANVVGPLKKFDRAADRQLREEKKRVEELRATKPPEKFLAIANELPGQIPETYVFHRGNPDDPGRTIAAEEIGDFLILNQTVGEAEIPADDPSLPSSGRRLAFAEYLTSGRHPLVARVQVNRIWMHHFGRGLVATPGDFGIQGASPTHPELLDWLADEWMANDWSVKQLHRLILTSRAYRQTSQRTPATHPVDSDNDFLARQNLRRLEAETVRDAVLAVSGGLNPEVCGDSVPVCVSDEGYGIVGIRRFTDIGHMLDVLPVGESEFRRSVYLQVRRNLPLPLLQVFDMPTMRPNCSARRVSTIAPQSLAFLNDDFVVRESERLAKRLQREFPDDLEGQIRQAWLLLFSRLPSAEELAYEIEFVKAQREPVRAGLERAQQEWDAYLNRPQTRTDEQHTHLHVKRSPPRELDVDTAALASLAQALMGTSQFLYVD